MLICMLKTVDDGTTTLRQYERILADDTLAERLIGAGQAEKLPAYNRLLIRMTETVKSGRMVTREGEERWRVVYPEDSEGWLSWPLAEQLLNDGVAVLVDDERNPRVVKSREPAMAAT